MQRVRKRAQIVDLVDIWMILHRKLLNVNCVESVRMVEMMKSVFQMIISVVEKRVLPAVVGVRKAVTMTKKAWFFPKIVQSGKFIIFLI